MKTRSIKVTTEFVVQVPADMPDDEIQDVSLEFDMSKIKTRTFAAPVRGAKVLSYTTTAIESNE